MSCIDLRPRVGVRQEAGLLCVCQCISTCQKDIAQDVEIQLSKMSSQLTAAFT